MLWNSPPRKHDTPNVVDVEVGSRIELDSSRSCSGEDTPGHASPPVPGSSGGDRRHRWHDTPRWRAVKSRMPAPLTRCSRVAWNWLKGPKPPRPNSIKPLLEPIQTFHTRLLARLPRFIRFCIFICAFLIWIVSFGVVLKNRSLPNNIAGFGAPIKLTCTNKLWYVFIYRINQLKIG